MSLHCKYDIVGFTETMKQESLRNLPGFSSPFTVSAKKRKKRGRNSGGILIYTKHNIRKGITRQNQTGFTKDNIFMLLLYYPIPKERNFRKFIF
jgi:hypothetical protein